MPALIDYNVSLRPHEQHSGRRLYLYLTGTQPSVAVVMLALIESTVLVK